MKKLLEKFKTEGDFNRFVAALSDRALENKPISDNAMIDGVIIAFIITNRFAGDMFLQKKIRVLDGTLQQLEKIVVWCDKNENELCSIF